MQGGGLSQAAWSLVEHRLETLVTLQRITLQRTMGILPCSWAPGSCHVATIHQSPPRKVCGHQSCRSGTKPSIIQIRSPQALRPRQWEVPAVRPWPTPKLYIRILSRSNKGVWELLHLRDFHQSCNTAAWEEVCSPETPTETSRHSSLASLSLARLSTGRWVQHLGATEAATATAGDWGGCRCSLGSGGNSPYLLASLPFAWTLAPGQARNLCGKPTDPQCRASAGRGIGEKIPYCESLFTDLRVWVARHRVDSCVWKGQNCPGMTTWFLPSGCKRTGLFGSAQQWEKSAEQEPGAWETRWPCGPTVAAPSCHLLPLNSVLPC
jgi:hypothetical protein